MRALKLSACFRALLLLVPLYGWQAGHGQINPFAFDTAVAHAASNGFSGIVLAAENGRPLYFKAFGFRDHEKHIPMHTSDVFELASVSKQFTAMIIMMLQEKGKLDFDEAISHYVAVPYPDITIRHLLCHTSGLPDYQALMDKYWDKTKVASNHEIIEYLNAYSPPRTFAPGAQYEYSNTGYVLLASIAEKASGEDFIQLCRKWIFTPLHMDATAIRTLEQKAAKADFALGHVYDTTTKSYVRADRFRSSDYTFWLGNRKGPGRISSNASDLLKWDQALYRNKLVKKSTLEQAFTPGKLNDGTATAYGFGWMLSDNSHHRIVFHTGDNPGYQTKIIRCIDKKRTLILLGNNDYPAFALLADTLQKIIDPDD